MKTLLNKLFSVYLIKLLLFLKLIINTSLINFTIFSILFFSISSVFSLSTLKLYYTYILSA